MPQPTPPDQTKINGNAPMWSSRLIGALWIASSAAGFGAMAIFAKIAYREGVDLATMLFLRFAIAGAIMALVISKRRLRWPSGRSLAYLIALGAAGYVGQAYCYFSALQYASAGLTAILLYLYPAIVTLGSAILSRRKLDPLRLIAVVAALGGTAMAVGGDTAGSANGVLFGIAAAVIYSVYILVGERVTRQPGAVVSSAVVMFAAAGTYAVFVCASGPQWPVSVAGWVAVTSIAVFSTAVAVFGFFAGLRRLGAADASTLSTLEPMMTIVLAAIFLGESITVQQGIGAAIVVASILVLARYGTEAGTH